MVKGFLSPRVVPRQFDRFYDRHTFPERENIKLLSQALERTQEKFIQKATLERRI